MVPDRLVNLLLQLPADSEGLSDDMNTIAMGKLNKAITLLVRSQG